MVDYSCDEIIVVNPIDIINNYKEYCTFIENYDNTQFDSINTSFNEQLQIINQNKYLLSKSNVNPSQIKQSLCLIIESLKNVQNMYSQVQQLFQEYASHGTTSPTSDSDNKIDELFKQFENEHSNLEKYIYKLNIAYKRIGIKQIREITLQVSKNNISSIFNKINTFFEKINESINSGNSIPSTNQNIFETNILFVQMHEILFHMDDELVDKLPDKMKTFIFNYISLSEYEFQYDVENTLINQLISDDTKSLIAYFDYNYWADEESKINIESNWASNDKTFEDTKTIKEEKFDNNVSSPIDSENESIKSNTKLNEDSIASTYANTSEPTEYIETHLTVKKPNIFIRILNKIKSLFSKHDKKDR